MSGDSLKLWPTSDPMNSTFSHLVLTLSIGLCLSLFQSNSSGAEEFQSLFNGKSLEGWKGAEGFWTVTEGSIVGETTKENPAKGNTFLVWQGGDVSDFEFTCKVKFEGNNSGVQYRSSAVDDAGVVLKGYQADLHPKPEYFGMMYGEKLGKRGIIATRHQKVSFSKDGTKNILATAAPSAEWVSTEWNTLRIVAVGNRLIHLVNGIVTVDITDDHPESLRSGKLGLQLHAGPAMTVAFQDLKYRPLQRDQAKQVLTEAASFFPAEKSAAKPSSNSKGSFAWVSEAPKPQWIWRAEKTDNKPIYLRHQFPLEGQIKSARLYATCDNGSTVWINEQNVGTNPDWGEPIRIADASKFLRSGANQIAIAATNRGGIAAFVFKLEVEMDSGEKKHILSGPDWKLSTQPPVDWKKNDFDDSTWTAKLKGMGQFGVSPWGVAGIAGPKGGGGNQSHDLSDTSRLTVAKGFTVDFLYSVPKNEQGSWVSLCSEPGGGFYASDQGDKGLYHISVSDGGTEITPLDLKDPSNGKNLSGAQGLLWAHDSLWFHRNGGHLYRITDSNGDGKLDKVDQQPSSRGGGEHGNHAVVLDEAGEGIYVVGGNHADIPPAESITRRRVQSWNEDHLLPRMWDARGHARGRLAPGGWISRYDPESKTHDLISIGFRNQYDATLNSAGDLFAYDADMEWDMGNHWYRPTRINFVASGSDHGWRSGTGKWPTYYEDSLPPVVEIGPGSPTGFVSGKDAKFSEKYQRAVYALDWTFGTIWAIHPEQAGAGYTGTKDVFVAGAPLPLTDGTIGEDGHFYFLVGGRGTQSAMYRVRYTGKESTQKAEPLDPTPQRILAKKLEAFHGVESPEAIEPAFSGLGSDDVFLRHAARVALESQPVDQWAGRLLQTENPTALIAGAVALARSAESSYQSEVVDALLAIDFDRLQERQKLGYLRAVALTFIRLGEPTRNQQADFIAMLDRHLPSHSADLNTELIRVLTYLQSPTVVSKTVALISDRGTSEIPDWTEIAARNARYGANVQKLLDNPPPSREIYYAMMLANARNGWTLEGRRTVVELLNDGAKTSGGASFPGFLANIRDLHLAGMTNNQRTALADISGENFNPVPDFPIQPIQGPGKNWTVVEASKNLNYRKADFERGRSLYFATSCGACHRLGGLGGDIGPDLTSIPNKFDNAYVLEAIINPSKDISDQYGMFEVTLTNGSKFTGLYVENGEDVSIYPPDHTAEPTRVKTSDVKDVKQLEISQMPPGLINSLNPDEVRDLMAYLMSSGNKEAKIYGK